MRPWRIHSGTGWPVFYIQDIIFWHLAGQSTPTGLAIGQLDRVLTYKNLIYLLNLRFCIVSRSLS